MGASPTAPEVDHIAPGQITTLAAGNATTSSIELSWNAPGDDDATGTATSYDIRRSTSPITDGNFGSADQVSGAPAPAVAGTLQSMTVTGLSEGTTYYFAIKTSDEVPNTSLISNLPSAGTSKTYMASAGYSMTTQGANQWSYQSYNGTSYADLAWNSTNSRWGTAPWVDVSAQLPSSTEAVRTWVAPGPGTITISGIVKKRTSNGDE